MKGLFPLASNKLYYERHHMRPFVITDLLLCTVNVLHFFRTLLRDDVFRHQMEHYFRACDAYLKDYSRVRHAQFWTKRRNFWTLFMQHVEERDDVHTIVACIKNFDIMRELWLSLPYGDSTSNDPNLVAIYEANQSVARFWNDNRFPPMTMTRECEQLARCYPSKVISHHPNMEGGWRNLQKQEANDIAARLGLQGRGRRL